MQEFGEKFWTRFTQGRYGSLWYYATLVEIYRKRVSGKSVRLVDRLERALDGLCVDKEEGKAALGYGLKPPELGGDTSTRP